MCGGGIFPSSEQKEGVSLASHSIWILDMMKPIETLIHLGTDRYDSSRSSLCSDIDECICHAIAAELSRAVAVFQRVTIMHRENVPGLCKEGTGMASWQGRHWVSHCLADCARLVRNDIVCFPDVEERHADFKVRNVSRSRNMSDRSKELQSVTFSFPW